MALNGQVTVVNPGTPVNLGSEKPCCSIGVKAPKANAGTIYVGIGAVSSSTGIPLAAGDTWIFDRINDLSQVKVDASNGNDKLAWIVLRA